MSTNSSLVCLDNVGASWCRTTEPVYNLANTMPPSCSFTQYKSHYIFTSCEVLAIDIVS